MLIHNFDLISGLTFDPRRLFGDEGVADVLRDSGVGPAREDPRAGGFGRLEQAFPETPLESRLQVEVGLAAADRNQQLGLLEAPFPQQQREHEFGSSVVRQANVLHREVKRKKVIYKDIDTEKRRTDLSLIGLTSAAEIDASVSVGGQG